MKFPLVAGIALAGVVELVAWALPGAVHQVATDPSVGPGPGAAIAGWFAVALLLAAGALANWLVWVGARPAPAQ